LEQLLIAKPAQTTSSGQRQKTGYLFIAYFWGTTSLGASCANGEINIAFFIDFVPSSVVEMKPENPTIEICPGITRRTLAHGKTMYQMMATLAAGSTMPPHSHPQEQIVHILEGQMRLIVDGVPHELLPGDSFYLASNVPHGVETLLPTRVLDTFSPPRDDYLAIDEKVRHGAL
jgi:quercetin dioxygenase-like cupin family protein